MKIGYSTKGLSIETDLLEKVLARAKAEDRSFSFIVRRAIKREMAEELLSVKDGPDSRELITAKQLATRLNCTVKNVLLRSRKPGDPLRAARSKIAGGHEVMFRVSKLNAIDRAA